ncbi:TetR/AcrR family transcriptional regulator [Terriglobus sp.]|uniref:TetR/AcrR family transcriptional regulator n=1 Tax=Terriglobus sp. TaxID=1889013 RepID=UPI003B00181B
MPAVAKTDREAILQAALVRLRRDGLPALSLRSLAADVGIATNALYHYFPSRSDLENALSDRAAYRMHAALQRDLARRSREAKLSPADRVSTLAAGYLRFAQREPHLYAAMVHGPCSTGETTEGHTALWQLVYEAAAALHGEAEASHAAVSLWALLHGTISLLQAGALSMKPDECIRFGLQAWMQVP